MTATFTPPASGVTPSGAGAPGSTRGSAGSGRATPESNVYDTSATLVEHNDRMRVNGSLCGQEMRGMISGPLATGADDCPAPR